ncbi:MFS transporter [Streptomyces sp. NRRL S-920]|uniref:MFS transporter n=1 Tax=Streptomyces sp. NRRL S-920 TaxID=1463921 RepID=UPI0004C4C157|nr:MFS transporter [Streptomyces sp. NRRL S-920]
MARKPDVSAVPVESAARQGPDPRRWWGLVVILAAQSLVVLDGTVVNIALPSVQRDLGMSDASRQWVITAYTLAFGGLLLLGGRVADAFGRRRIFAVGILGFGLASLLGGAAPDPGTLFLARALQGVFAAALAPAALALINTLFTEPGERGKAFGVYGAVSGGGAAVGLLAGGLLTEYLDWRWCLYVNAPVALLALAGCRLLPRDRRTGRAVRLDLPGTLLGCGGLVAIVYAFAEAESGWGDPLVVRLLVLGVLMLVAFALVERRVQDPLLPPRVVAHRVRGGSFLVVGLPQIGLFGLFLFLTYYLQGILDYSPVLTGVAFLPLGLGIAVGSSLIAARLLPRTRPRTLIVGALLAAAAGMALLTRLEPETPQVYLTHLLPAQILIGLGIGCMMMPAMHTATARVAPHEAGAAAAVVNSAQQVGGALGVALLNTVSTGATAAYLAEHGTSPAATVDGTVHGYTVAIAFAVGVLLLTAVLAWVLIDSRTEAAEGTGSDPVTPARPR